jgi:hypothetical protein
MPGRVLQHVGVAPARSHVRQRSHESTLILSAEYSSRRLLQRRHQAPELTVRDGRVSHQLQLVGGVEGDQLTHRPAAREGR